MAGVYRLYYQLVVGKEYLVWSYHLYKASKKTKHNQCAWNGFFSIFENFIGFSGKRLQLNLRTLATKHIIRAITRK